ncbi:hypothetical protein D1872_277220 [compost metagenome]
MVLVIIGGREMLLVVIPLLNQQQHLRRVERLLWDMLYKNMQGEIPISGAKLRVDLTK